MPIRPEQSHKYPEDWSEISRRIRFERAAGRCECDGRCGSQHHTEAHLSLMRQQGADVEARCSAIHGHFHPVTGSKVVLTTAHLDHEPGNCDDDNLMAMCQKCHLNYDKALHHQTRRRHKAAGDLFEEQS